MNTVEEINMALFERVIRDLITQDEFALDEEMTNLEAAAFIAEAREEIENLSLIHISEPTRPY